MLFHLFTRQYGKKYSQIKFKRKLIRIRYIAPRKNSHRIQFKLAQQCHQSNRSNSFRQLPLKLVMTVKICIASIDKIYPQYIHPSEICSDLVELLLSLKLDIINSHICLHCKLQEGSKQSLRGKRIRLKSAINIRPLSHSSNTRFFLGERNASDTQRMPTHKHSSQQMAPTCRNHR
ncbi:hypothetical protein TcasGA2_TC011109 [Tribolium castaneum]|uniref:Uncharacterized protein n=1 Tax=Tribolium castaneum TaxID=7070 RepID=D6X487_TRICA|nr:hypothetical protein TcasGA2_TC011109 [Tribolium castaneum]